MTEEQIAFTNVYIERCDKETENLLAEEERAFLKNTIDYLKKNKNEFIYLESHYFSELGVDALSLEIDDVFGTYDVMLGLKKPKKAEQGIKEYLDKQLNGDEVKFDLMFDQTDGLWNVNFTFNLLNGFREEMTFEEAFQLIYLFLSSLVEHVNNQ